MKPKYLRILSALILLEGLIAEYFLFVVPSDPSRGRILNYSYARLGLAGITFLALLLLAWLLIRSFRDVAWVERISNYLNEKLTGPEKRLFTIQGGLVITIVALIEGYLLTFFYIPPILRPHIIWAMLICFQAWLGLRVIYATIYRQRPSLASQIRSKWQAWTPTQRRVFVVLSILGLIYFAAFIPFNRYGLHTDEHTIYPDVVTVLMPGETFVDTLRNVLIKDSWWYGYPYFPLSALTILIPRLIIGDGFAEQWSLNLLFMRQFISVLPMTLSIFFLVYLLTRFKSVLRSVGMFVFLLLIPGVVKYNYQFWHPDGLIVLLTVLTLYFLQKDQLKFGRFFYLAAVMCGLATALKMWGVYFFLTIGGYLLAGWLQKILTFKKMMLAGVVFILVMAGTILISSPSLLIPWVRQAAINETVEYLPVMSQGYEGPDPEGVYQTGLKNWLRFFEMYFAQNYFFFFLVFALAAASLLGSETYLSRLLLGWCLVVGVYLIFFLAVKPYHYMLPLAIPLYSVAFLFPTIADGEVKSKRLSFLTKPLTRKVLWAITIGMVGSQFVFNIVDIFTSPVMGF